MAEFSGHNTGCLDFLGVKMAPLNIPLQRRLQTAAVLAWVATLLFAGWISLLILLYLAFFTDYWWVSLSYLTWYFGDRGSQHRGGGRRWRWLQGLRLWSYYANFFPMELIKTTELPSDRNYIMAYHPHGVMALGTTALITHGAGAAKKFPGLDAYLPTLSMNFLLPFSRELLMAIGLLSMEGGSEALREHPNSGKALVVVPGGSLETLESQPGKATLVLKNKAGFIKMALKHGASLVPVYGFGETEVFDQALYSDTSLVRKLQRLFHRLMGFSPVIIKGRGIFQYSWGVLPKRKPISVIVGSPIEVELNLNPSISQVSSLHKRYTEALQLLYNTHRHKYAPRSHGDLTII